LVTEAPAHLALQSGVVLYYQQSLHNNNQSFVCLLLRFLT